MITVNPVQPTTENQLEPTQIVQQKPLQNSSQVNSVTTSQPTPVYQPKPYLGKKPFNPEYKKTASNVKKANVTINQAPQPPVQLTGGFWRDNSLIPQKQTGGFIRDNSLIPQPFFELNKS